MSCLSCQGHTTSILIWYNLNVSVHAQHLCGCEYRRMNYSEKNTNNEDVFFFKIYWHCLLPLRALQGGVWRIRNSAYHSCHCAVGRLEFLFHLLQKNPDLTKDRPHVPRCVRWRFWLLGHLLLWIFIKALHYNQEVVHDFTYLGYVVNVNHILDTHITKCFIKFAAFLCNSVWGNPTHSVKTKSLVHTAYVTSSCLQ